MTTNGMVAGGLVGLVGLVLMPAQATAHCRPWHPYHCVIPIPVELPPTVEAPVVVEKPEAPIVIDPIVAGDPIDYDGPGIDVLEPDAAKVAVEGATASQQESGFEIGFGSERGDACADAQQRAEQAAAGYCSRYRVQSCTQCTKQADDSWSCGASWSCTDSASRSSAPGVCATR